jgi:DNA-binding transcriptional ArsR family regulator
MGGWMIGYSLPHELDGVLYYATSRDNYVLPRLPPSMATLIQSLNQEWHNEWEQLSPEPLTSFSVLELLGGWANTIFEGDFRRATLPMRDLRLKDAIDVRAAQLEAYGESLPALPTEVATLQTLEQQLTFTIYRVGGFPTPNEALIKRRIAGEVERAATFLRDGKHHSAFWFFIDRFYYETYLPWRTTRLPYMEALAQRAALVLGGNAVNDPKSGALPTELEALTPANATLPSGILYYNNVPPSLEWLPAQNLLRSSPKVAERVQQGKTLVYFWVEPFEMFDSSFMEPGVVATSFAEPGVSFENFLKFVESLGSRAQAFADPTRLIIMRMIRHFSLDNTTMSNYMGISRPTVSEHARILREAGFIQTYQEGRQARHEVQPEAVAQFLRDLIQYLDLDIEV